MSPAVTVSVIIVNWNVRDCLIRCLRSLFADTGGPPLEVFIVDNNSADGSVEAVHREFPNVTVIVNTENVGFARANNQGCRESTGEYVLLLNPDTVIIEDSLARMVRFMESQPDVGVSGPKLLNADRTIQYTCARALPLPRDALFAYTKLSSLFPRSRFFGRQLMGYWDHKDSRDVECLSGACLFIRRRTLQEVGGLDEGYPLYAEDTDWCYRVKQAGWRLHYYAEAQVTHIGRQSSLQNRGRATLSGVYSLYRYHCKFHGRSAGVRLWLFLWMASILKLSVWTGLYVIGIGPREQSLEQVRTYWEVCRRIVPLSTMLSR